MRMKCLCCGKIIKESAAEVEKENRWHNRCVKAFFGTKQLPVLDVTDEQLNALAQQTVSKGFTVPGVQRKLSLHLLSDREVRLTLVNYPTGYILKPQTAEYSSLPEYEDLAMRLAEAAGVLTVPHALFRMKGQYAYITKRIDRDIQGDRVQLYAMEDFCQLSGRLTQDKYKGSYENCARIINKYSVHSKLDLSELFLRVAVSLVIGNSDMHLKNFSLIEMEPVGREFCISRAYDMLPVNVIMPQDQDELALTLNGKKRNIRRKDLLLFAEHCELNRKTAEKILARLASLEETFLQLCEDSYLSEEQKEMTKTLIRNRINRICGMNKEAADNS